MIPTDDLGIVYPSFIYYYSHGKLIKCAYLLKIDVKLRAISAILSLKYRAWLIYFHGMPGSNGYLHTILPFTRT